MKKRILVLSIATSLLCIANCSTVVKADPVSSQEQTTTQSSQTQQNNQTQDKQTQNQSAAQTESNKQNSSTDNSQKTTDPNKNNQTKQQTTQTNNGWKQQNGQTYYLKDGQISKGLTKIESSWYLFDKKGAMLKSVRKIPRSKIYGYFDQQGKRRFKNTSTKKAYYWINKKGQITGIKNNAKIIRQRPEMPTGCEIVATTMMLNFAGKKVSKFQAAKIMPRSSNPNKGFIGSPYKKFPLGYWVAPGGIKPVVDHYLGKSKIMTKCSINAIKLKLLRSHLVVAWLGWFDGFSNHAITLTGYHGNTFYYNDPWTGKKSKMSINKFKIHWALDGHRAISY